MNKNKKLNFISLYKEIYDKFFKFYYYHLYYSNSYINIKTPISSVTILIL